MMVDSAAPAAIMTVADRVMGRIPVVISMIVGHCRGSGHEECTKQEQSGQ
jgi:hypothetical protein